ncbi:MAG TPA: hypothetical protein VFO40_15590 [Chthoniobacterales bacterium]|nr:hypothetical protein [Chthoniobacterales bacterium]
MKYPDWIIECAQAVVQMHNDGVHDPSHEEIARAYHGRKSVPPALIRDVRKNLRVLQKILRTKYGLLVCTTGANYYLLARQLDRGKTFRELPPQDEDECAFVSPLGREKPRYGLYIAQGKKDLYWLYMNSFHRHSASSSTRHGLERLVNAKKAGHIALRPARKEARETIDAIPPENISSLGSLGNGENDNQDNSE